jgi:hypothetical protein
LEDAAGTVPQADEGGQAFSGQRSIGFEGGAAIDDGQALSAV